MAKTQTGLMQNAPIAVVSIGAIFPGRGHTTGFWRDIFEGVDTFQDVPETHWLPEDYYDPDPAAPDKTYGRRGGFIAPIKFDPVAFGVPPNALQSTDTSQLLALVAAQQVLEEAERETGGRLDRARTSVVLGVASATEMTAHMAGRLSQPAWVKGMREAGIDEATVQDAAARIAANFAEWKESTFPGLLGNVVAGRIANRLDLGGSNYVADAACASSLAAVQIGLHELRSGESDTVLVGGVDTLNDILMYMCFSKTPALSRSGDCRPFSADADGTMLGEGIGMLALRRLDDAERDGNRIHAVIRGLGGASDGRATAIYAPLASGQARALTRAYEQAGYGPETVDLVEAHGTGTVAGDRTELEGLHAVFAPDGPVDAPWCAVGSVKSQIGHTKAAAGAASLIKTVAALSRKILPPTIKVTEPAEALREGSPFYLNTVARPWIKSPKVARRASVSSFGFGGSNFHCTLEGYTGPNVAEPPRVLPCELVMISAPGTDELCAAVQAAREAVTCEADLANLATRSHARFAADAPLRAAIVARSVADFHAKADKLIGAVERGTSDHLPQGGGVHFASGPVLAGKTAFLFAGQGSQYVGMGADLAMAFPAARRVWDKLCDHPAAGAMQLHELSFPAPAFDEASRAAQMASLTRVDHAQPAIGAVALAQLAVLDQLGLTADMAAGHSFGEVMALHYGGALSAKNAISVAVARGRAMAEAADKLSGSMMAVQADAETALGVVAKEGLDLVAANKNSPTQTVLSGPVEEIGRALGRFEAAGIKARQLPVGTAFHSPIVAPAVETFAEALSEIRFRNAKLPVFSNKDGQPFPKTGQAIARALPKQIANPVEFSACLEALYAQGARTFVEIGPGNILSGLVRDNLQARDDICVVNLDQKSQNGTFAFLNGIARLSLAGQAMDLSGLFGDLPPEPEPTDPPKFSVEITGANYNKPYPPRGGAAALPPPNAAAPEQPEPQASRMEVQEEGLHQEMSQPPARTAPAPLALQAIADSHTEFVKAMTNAHTSFLQATTALYGGGVAPGGPSAPLAPPVRAAGPVPPPVAPPAPAPSQPTIMAAPDLPPAITTPPGGPSSSAAPSPSPASARVPATFDALAFVTGIVAEKTGYPTDMLDPDMDLEGELGIDSIKQVEILSSLRDDMPDLPEIEPEQLSELRTIRLVAGFIGGAAPAATPAPAKPESAPAATVMTTSSSEGGGPSVDAIRMLISDKTGYPPDMLDQDMDLEGELGIDSIKQVEILSALRDLYPDLPEIEPEDMAELRSIRKIADFFQ